MKVTYELSIGTFDVTLAHAKGHGQSHAYFDRKLKKNGGR